MHPSVLLFEKKFGDGKPLFDSQTDLVRAITEFEGSEWKGKNFNSVRAFVNQVINGERKLSDKLKKAIFIAIEHRANKEQNINELQNSIEQAFIDFFDNKKELKKQATSSEVISSSLKQPIEADDFHLLEKRGLLADTILITTRKPELVSNPEISNELKQQLLTKVGILDSDENFQPASYEFYFPFPNKFDDTAFRFWKGLYSYLKYDYKISDPDQQLIQINEGENARVKVFCGPALLCSFPIIIYDFNNRTEVGFTVFDYEDKGVEKISTARISPAFIKWWKAEVYAQLQKGQEFEVKEMKFNSILTDIKKNEGLF